MDTLTRIAFCPHCCNRAPQKAIAVHTCSETTWFESDDGGREEEVDYDGTYFVATCATCKQLLLYWKQGDPDDEGPSGQLAYFRQSGLIWPARLMSGSAVPAPVAAIYAEAAVVKGYVHRVVTRGELAAGGHPDAFELSFSMPPGLSEAPLFLHAQPRDVVVGVCVGANRAEAVDFQYEEILEGGEVRREKRVRVEEYGIAHDLRPLLGWKPPVLKGLPLAEAAADA